MDTSSDPHRYLFVVRLWLEFNLNADGQKPADPAGEKRGQWRGSVESMDSGQRLYFTSLAGLNDFILLQLGGPGSALALTRLKDIPDGYAQKTHEEI